MATDQWDLRDGFTKDFNLGDSAVSAADKQYREAQSIIDTAYNLDREGETQQSNIDAINAKNKAYLDTVESTTAVTNAKNTDLLGDYAAKTELEKAMQAAEGYANEDTPATKEQTGFKDVYLEEFGGVAKPYAELTDEQKQRAKADGQVIPVFNETAQQSTQRPRTQLERLQAALPQLNSPRAKAIAQDAIRKEITSQAYQLHAFEPDKALKLLRENGMGVAVNLIRGNDGNFKQILSSGKELSIDPILAAAMVGDVMKSTDTANKLLEARRAEANKLASDNFKSKRDFDEKLVLQKDQQAAQLQRAQLGAAVRLQAGRYGRSVDFDEDGNPIVGRSLGGSGSGSGSGGGGGQSTPKNSAAAIASGQSAQQSAPKTALNLEAATYEQIQGGLQKLQGERSKINDKTSPEYGALTSKIGQLQEIAKKKDLERKPSLKVQIENSDPSKKLATDKPIRNDGEGAYEFQIRLTEWNKRKASYNESLMNDAARGGFKTAKQLREQAK
jgi:hypothetical protein